MASKCRLSIKNFKLQLHIINFSIITGINNCYGSVETATRVLVFEIMNGLFTIIFDSNYIDVLFSFKAF